MPYVLPPHYSAHDMNALNELVSTITNENSAGARQQADYLIASRLDSTSEGARAAVNALAKHALSSSDNPKNFHVPVRRLLRCSRKRVPSLSAYGQSL